MDQFVSPMTRLTPDLERRFQADYYARIRPGLRLVSLLLAGLVAAQTLLRYDLPSPIAFGTPELVFWLCAFGLTWGRGFGRVWQPVLLLLGWTMAAVVLGSLGHTLSGPPGHTLGGPPLSSSMPHSPSSVAMRFSFVLQMSVLMMTLSTLRLPYRWAALLQGGVLLIGLWNFGTNLPPDANILRDLHFILLPALVLLLALLLTAFAQEQLARSFPSKTPMRKRMLALLVLVLAPTMTPAWGHAMPHSDVILRLRRGGVDARLVLPIIELQLGWQKPLPMDAPQTIAQYGPDLKGYVLQHVRATAPDGRPWTIAVRSLTPIAAPPPNAFVASSPSVEANLTLTPPPGAPADKLTLHYDVIFHRLITHTAIISISGDWRNGVVGGSPVILGTMRDTHPVLVVDRSQGSWARGFAALFGLGARHIAEGTDHLLFLLALLLPAPLLVAGRRWGKYAGGRVALRRIVKIATAFTAGHSVTLLLGAAGAFHVPEAPIECAIALSIFVSALHALVPIFRGREVWIAGGFGLVHGLAFAATLTEFGLDPLTMASSVLAFNLGIEAVQIFVIVVTMPWLLLLARTRAYPPFRVAGACVTGIAALGWMGERAFGWSNLVGVWVERAAAHAPWVVIDLAALYGAAVIPHLFPLPGSAHTIAVLGMRSALFVLCGVTTLWLTDRAQRMQVQAEHRREVVASLQSMILPDTLARVPGYDLCGLYRPAYHEEEVGGDFYDFYPMGNGVYGLMMGDVMGKGKEAAASTALLRYSVHAFASVGASPGQLLTQMNDLLETQGLRFGTASLFAGFLDTRSGLLCYASAGHEAPLLQRSDGQGEMLDATGPILGVGPGVSYQEKAIVLHIGDALLLMTDGVTEARNEAGTFLDSTGAWGLLCAALHQPSAQKAIASIDADLRAYIGDSRRDDIAVLLVRRTGRGC